MMGGICPTHIKQLEGQSIVAMSHVNFLSYNSTGLSEIKIKWIRDLCFSTNASFIGIQEHFRKNKNIDNIFGSGFPERK